MSNLLIEQRVYVHPIDIFPNLIFFGKWQLTEEIFKNYKFPPPKPGVEPQPLGL